MAAFLTGLYELEFAKGKYEAAVAETVPLMKEKIAEEGDDVLKAAHPAKKAQTFVEFLQSKVLQKVTGNSEEAMMFREKLERLSNLFKELKETTSFAIKRYTD